MIRWFSGPPPSEGWWPTAGSLAQEERGVEVSYRYWNGLWWSYAARDGHSEKEAAYLANLQSPFQDLVRWMYWGFRLPGQE